MLITQKEYAERHGINFGTVRAAVGRGALPHTVDAKGKRLVEDDDPWYLKHKKYSKMKGASYTKLYWVHHGMRHRCSSPYASGYKNYGGRGISVCEEWDKSFQAFYDWAMSHGYREGLQIDRIDNDGNYEPSNCRWVTPSENAKNKRKKDWRVPIDTTTATYYDLKEGAYVWVFDPLPIYILKNGTVVEERYPKWYEEEMEEIEKRTRRK